MGLIGDILGGGFKGIASGVRDLLGAAGLDKGKAAEASLAIEALLQKRDSEIEETLRREIGAKERIMVAELQQDDKYTKRLRPTIGYGGLLMIAIVEIVPRIAHLFGNPVEITPLPMQFWATWGGLVGIYSFGRSQEKRGNSGRLTRAITGGRKLPSMLD